MRRSTALMAAVVAAVSFSFLVSSANANPVGTTAGIRQGLAETSAVQQVVRVCQHNMFTSRRVCFVDRSRPPTVCHHLRASSRRDCY